LEKTERQQPFPSRIDLFPVWRFCQLEQLSVTQVRGASTQLPWRGRF
jgi:hypothetical protein